MIKAYVNSTDARVTIHNNPNCASARITVTKDQRTVLINTDSLSREIRRFKNNEYRLTAQAEMNDLWLILDFHDAEFENALASYLKRLVAQGHKTTGDWELEVHC
jgi:hypothetical protein